MSIVAVDGAAEMLKPDSELIICEDRRCPACGSGVVTRGLEEFAGYAEMHCQRCGEVFLYDTQANARSL